MPNHLLITEICVRMEMPFASLLMYTGKKSWQGFNSILVQFLLHIFVCIKKQYFILKGQNFISLTLQRSVGCTEIGH